MLTALNDVGGTEPHGASLAGRVGRRPPPEETMHSLIELWCTAFPGTFVQSSAIVALASMLGCGGVSVPPSNGAKLGQAAAFAGVAGVAQVAQSVIEQRARNNAPMRRGGVSASPNCDNEGQ